jgi:hypothetical protein
MGAWCILAVALALTWLLYETNWLTVRLPMGPMGRALAGKTIKLFQCAVNSQVGITTREDGVSGIPKKNDKTTLLLGPGIEEPVCGWEWLLNRAHPLIENRIEIVAHNCRHNIHLCDNPNIDQGRVMKEVCAVAFKPLRVAKHGASLRHRKGQTFNPYYGQILKQSEVSNEQTK